MDYNRKLTLNSSVYSFEARCLWGWAEYWCVHIQYMIDKHCERWAAQTMVSWSPPSFNELHLVCRPNMWLSGPFTRINLGIVLFCHLWLCWYFTFLQVKDPLCQKVDFWVSLPTRQTLMLWDCGSAITKHRYLTSWEGESKANFPT